MNELLTNLKSINKEYLSPKDILNATKIDVDDRICYCLVKSMVLGRVVSNPIWIYVDDIYTDEDRLIEDINNDCRTICEFLNHEFIEVVNYKIN